ncbi:MAG: hypothetical protein KAR05_07790 [Candidatus Omnitrophica bacterium]|nr:hypothetical protein [Candidatus Omnitrophota bacterium]
MIKNLDLWLKSYWQQEIKRLKSKKHEVRPVHIMFCLVDHFEPDWGGADFKAQMWRVQQWVDRYPRLAREHVDADDVCPAHSFFYPAEVYNEAHMYQLEKLCRAGLAEVNIHLHHDRDDEQGLRQKLSKAKDDFLRHGFLGKDKEMEGIRYAFIHGNWALNNSRSDGRWCGVNNESNILNDTGCYADFTLPSAPSSTQTSMINSLYYDEGNEARPKSHDGGTKVKVGGEALKQLMIIQGPLTLNWRRRKFGIIPRIENSDICSTNPPTDGRINLWVKQNISVLNKPDWAFVKVHTHGAQEKNMSVLLGDSLDSMFSHLETNYNDGENFVLHYVTAREMYNIIKAAEAGKNGNPGLYRDFLIEKNM